MYTRISIEKMVMNTTIMREIKTAYKEWLGRFIVWREHHIKEKRFILILSFMVGIFTAFAALILKMLIH